MSEPHKVGLRANDFWPEHTLSLSTQTSWIDADIQAIRAATAEAANRFVDLSYITDDFMAPRMDVPEAGGQDFEAAEADAVIATYGGAPLSGGHRFVWYGHHAALLDDGTIGTWFFLSVTYKDGTFIRGTQLFRAYGEATVVGELDDGSPLWEFRI
jgi:hypothetical protein